MQSNTLTNYLTRKALYRAVLACLLFVVVITTAAGTGLTPARASFDTSEIVGWGWNGYGQISTPADLTDVVAISVGGYHNLALKSDGTVAAWGSNTYGQSDVPAGLSNVVAISAGTFHSLALKADGTVTAWGWNLYGQANSPASLTDVVAIGAGEFHNIARKSDGTFVGWGSNGIGQISIPSNLTDAVAFDVGYIHNLAIRSDGTVVGWGTNLYGEINIPAGLTDVVAVSAGAHHSLALKSDGTVVAWGSNNQGQTALPDNLTGVIAIAAGSLHSLALKNDGTVVGWGWNGDGQATPPASLSGVTAIYAGESHNLALVPAEPEVPANAAPTANAGGPYLGAVNTSIAFDGSLSSDPEGDALSYAWSFGDSATADGSTPSHTYSVPGIYNICLTVNDGALDSEPACTLAVVYDPSAGFVTGGGWIDSPAGAFKFDESLTGKATFGFMAKYQKGASVPTGNTAFVFDLAGVAFASQNYEWLVVNQGGMNAQFKGSGLINGAADPNGNPFKFILWAADGSPDTFRIRIWWEDAAGEQDVYDNGAAQAIGAGNIVVHTGK